MMMVAPPSARIFFGVGSLAIAVSESRAAEIDNIFAWSYRGTETLSWLKSDNPDEVARVFRNALNN